MIKNFSIYIITVIEILLLGFIYEHYKNVSLGNLFYFSSKDEEVLDSVILTLKDKLD